ncbi:RsmE family RNA methyltransferase [Neorhodopirellula pilleata]|uniref:Ribosomal RNA small subunit methyltransferase E n=1 Tax=Neorhodopirellula pilleata TaxID=2714738 RepID=A0A5C6A1B9_9BACT|nr:RsmE family RNA methyltransferase [Neorhodopirellula pilleata]TWT93008.1 Ribosomal RNA small subunit methyltransferase E [Neorhodopirellula pilleata]
MTRRYYVPNLAQMSGLIELPPEEAAHAARVMRVVEGDTIELFDGQGHQAAAAITHVSKRQCVCRIDSIAAIDLEPSVNLIMAIAIPKPDRAKEMIERLTEIGVHQVQPIVFERTQRAPGSSLIEKLERVVIEACKQSGRNHLMPILPVLTFGQWITKYRQSDFVDRTAYVAMPSGNPTSIDPIRSNQSSPPESSIVPECLVVIGPEGGLTESELQDCLDASIKPVDLGKRILRIETAACVIASRLLTD